MFEPSIQAALRESVVEVLEKMFFISAFEGPLEKQPAFQPCLTARLTFEGDPPGSLSVLTTCGAARAIAADFLGEEPAALSARQVEEVLCELANMICGAVLSRVECQSTFRLGSPQIVRVDWGAPVPPPNHGPQTGPLPAGTIVRLADIGDDVLMVAVHTEEPACTVIEKYVF